MKKEIIKEIEIPEGINVEIDGTKLVVEGPEGKNQRNYKMPNVSVVKNGNKVIVSSKKATKNEKKLVNSFAAHVKNMIDGVQKKFEYKLKICFSHFPITVEVKGKEIIIKNFLGEKIPRKTTIPEGVEVDVNKDVVTVKSTDLEKAGQVAANFEVATRIRNRDKRVFQDGIFITSKAGSED